MACKVLSGGIFSRHRRYRRCYVVNYLYTEGEGFCECELSLSICIPTKGLLLARQICESADAIMSH